MCNFFFCHYVFKKPSAAEASESVYMRERVNKLIKEHIIKLEYAQIGTETSSENKIGAFLVYANCHW